MTVSSTPVTFTPIGIIHSSHQAPDKTPIQPVFAEGSEGRVEVFEQYAEGLKDVEGFSHLFLFYVFHKVGPPRLTAKPFLEDVEHGIFAIRAPWRPNPLGMSLVELVRREGNVLVVDGIDVLDGTPLLDIKPYCAKFDRRSNTRHGWYDAVDPTTAERRGARKGA